MADKRRIAKGILKTESIKHLDESKVNLPSLGDKAKIPTPTTSTINPPDEIMCNNCRKCICRNWNGNVTPQFITFLEEMLNSMKNSLMKNTPTLLDMEIELYPGSGVYLAKRKVLLAINKAKDNPRAMIRNLLSSIFTDQEIFDFNTGQKLFLAKPDVFLAIREYLKSNHNIEITKSQFVNVINHKIGDWKYKTKLTEEELEKRKTDKKIKARVNRHRKRKVDEQQNLSKQNLKKLKVKADKTTERPPFSESDDDATPLLSSSLQSLYFATLSPSSS